MCVLLCIFRTTLYLLGVLQSVALCSPFFIVCVSPFLSLLLRRLRRLRLRLLFFFVGVFFSFFHTRLFLDRRKKERTNERKKEGKKERKKERKKEDPVRSFIFIILFSSKKLFKFVSPTIVVVSI